MPVDLNSRYADGHFENFYQNPRTINSSYTGVRRASTPLLLRQPLPKYYVDSVYQWTAETAGTPSHSASESRRPTGGASLMSTPRSSSLPMFVLGTTSTCLS